MEYDTKLIDCPEHNGKHKATLYCWPHKYAGIWECDETNEGISDSHEHNPENYEIEEIEHPSSNPDSSYYWVERVYVCGGDDGCGVTIDRDTADPDLDRAEYLAERDCD